MESKAELDDCRGDDVELCRYHDSDQGLQYSLMNGAGVVDMEAGTFSRNPVDDRTTVEPDS